MLAIVTRTDLLEAITGDLADVGEEPEIVEQNDGTLLVDGMMAVDELSFTSTSPAGPRAATTTPLQASRSFYSAQYPSLAISSPGRDGASRSPTWTANGSTSLVSQEYRSDSCRARLPVTVPTRTSKDIDLRDGQLFSVKSIGHERKKLQVMTALVFEEQLPPSGPCRMLAPFAH
jgi:hypothetical protein